MDLETRRRDLVLSFFRDIETYGTAPVQRPSSPSGPLTPKSKLKRKRCGWPLSTIVSGRALEKGSIREPFVLLSSKGGTAMAVTSILAYRPYELERRVLNLVDEGRVTLPSFLPGIDDLNRYSRGAESYKHLLLSKSSSHSSTASDPSSDMSSFSSISSVSTDSAQPGVPEHYDPLFLDDPELTSGRHRTVVTMPSFISSINHYAAEEEIKKELNDRFRQLHPYLEPSITLSMIRNLKTSLLKLSLMLDIEMYTVAVSYALFEKLLLGGHVVKANRRLVGACCLLLSIKSCDYKETAIDEIVGALCNALQISKPDLFRTEFSVFAALSFNVHLPSFEYLSHFERIFAALPYSNFQEYLGERMYALWTHDA